MSGINFEDLRKIVSQLSDEERRKLLETSGAKIPAFVWNSNPLGFKATLKYLGTKKKATRLEVRDHLRTLGLVKDPRNKCRFGILFPETAVFAVDDSKSGGNIAKDIVTLTPLGEELARLFDDNMTEFSPIETVIARGLQQQSGGYTFLSLIARSPGIERKTLSRQMVAIYKGKGAYFTNYYAALLPRLGLVTTRRTGRWTKFYLTIPEGWIDRAPSAIL